MKAGVVPEFGTVEFSEVPDPEPGPYDCLVDIEAAAICTGTDSSIIDNTFPWVTDPPFILGHESTGLIVEVGEKVRNFREGQRVTRPAGILPGRRIDGIGSNWGGFAEMGLVQDGAAAEADGVDPCPMAGSMHPPLPDDVDPVSAALSINQREILSVVERMELTYDSRVCVVGSGYNGLLFSLLCGRAGAGRVVMVGHPGRAEVARQSFDADALLDYRDDFAAPSVRSLLGADPSHVIDAVGTVRSVQYCRRILAPHTAFGRYGVHELDEIIPLVEEIQQDHPALEMGTDESGATEQWYALWKEGFFTREGMYDGTAPLEDIVEAFERLRRREAVKIVLTM